MFKNRLVLKKYGLNPKNCVIFNKVDIRIKKSSRITIGDNFVFTSGSGTNPLSGNIEGTIYVDENAILQSGINMGYVFHNNWQ